MLGYGHNFLVPRNYRCYPLAFFYGLPEALAMTTARRYSAIIERMSGIKSSPLTT